LQSNGESSGVSLLQLTQKAHCFFWEKDAFVKNLRLLFYHSSRDANSTTMLQNAVV